MTPLLTVGVAGPIIACHLNNTAVKSTTTISINTVIPANTSIGEIQIVDGLTAPTEKQILGTINVWIASQSAETKAKWHINQVYCNDIQTGGCKILVQSWSPDYDTSSYTNVVYSTKTPTQKKSLREALTGSSTGTDAVILNNISSGSGGGTFDTWLKTQNATNISSLKGDNKKTALLRWLDNSNLYNNGLHINQIDVTTPLSWDATNNQYSFVINAKSGSNIYTNDSLTVAFKVGRININGISDLTKRLSFVITPSTQEIYSQFTYVNSTKITSTNLPFENFDFTSLTKDGVTFTVNGNEYYETSTGVTLSWSATEPVALSTVISSTDLGALPEDPRDHDDIKYLVGQANSSYPIEWNDITIGEINATNHMVVLTPKAGSIYYTSNAVTITWSLLS